MSIQVNASTIDGASNQSSTAAVHHLSTKADTAGDSADTIGADTVSLSGASNLVALAKQLSSTDRQAKINALTEQVRSGQYQPNPEAISRAIVQSMTEG